jgi:hypothetical protein
VAHAARFDGGSTTGSCSAARGTFRAVQRITQSVCVTLVNRATYSLSEMPSTASSRLLSVRFDSPGGDRASFQNCPSAFFRPRRIASSLMASVLQAKARQAFGRCS